MEIDQNFKNKNKTIKHFAFCYICLEIGLICLETRLLVYIQRKVKYLLL